MSKRRGRFHLPLYCRLRMTLRVFILLPTRKRRFFLFFFYLLCVGKTCKKRIDCVGTNCWSLMCGLRKISMSNQQFDFGTDDELEEEREQAGEERGVGRRCGQCAGATTRSAKLLGLARSARSATPSTGSRRASTRRSSAPGTAPSSSLCMPFMIDEPSHR